MNKPLVLFNLMGTLVDTSPRLIQAFQQACTEYNLTPPDGQKIRELLGNYTLPQITTMLVPDLPKDTHSAFFSRCNEIALALIGRVEGSDKISKNVKARLEEIKAEDKKIGVFSGAQIAMVLAILQYNELSTFFDYVEGNQEAIGRSSSMIIKLAQLQTILRASKELPKNILVVGDSLSDQSAAIECGFSYRAAPTFFS